MAKYQVLYWKNIPSQLKVFEEGKKPFSRRMPDRFQSAINRTATQEGLTGTDEYLKQWHWTETMEREGAAEELADVLLQELEQETKIGEDSVT